jgi:hypothetical protein
MDAQLMQKLQGSGDAVWLLPERSSMTLRVGPGPRVLQVCAGRLWLTASSTASAASPDVWLVPGDSLELASGLEVVMEAWPSARFQLLVPPCRRSSRGASTLWSALARGFARFGGRPVSTLQPNLR